MDIVVQPAVSWMELNDKLTESGLFFPVDPGPSVGDRNLISAGLASGPRPRHRTALSL